MSINQKEAEIVRFIFAKYLERKNLTEVSALCRENGFSGKRGKQFTPSSLLVILTRFVYCGFYAWHGEPLKAGKGEFEPLISIDSFNKVQALLKSQGTLTGRKRVIGLIFLKKE